MSALKTNGAEALAASATDTPTWTDTFTAEHDISQGRGATDEPRIEMTVEDWGDGYQIMCSELFVRDRTGRCRRIKVRRPSVSPQVEMTVPIVSEKAALIRERLRAFERRERGELVIKRAVAEMLAEKEKRS